MTAQTRVHDLDLDGILAQAVPDNFSQAVRENGNSLLPYCHNRLGAFEQS
jgi:hypothetical protein